MSRSSIARRAGFTLVEMSIVIVIIGLIVGGVLAGKELVRNAQLRSVLSDIDTFNTAINSFRNKYNCLPGDCANATDFFDQDPTGCDKGQEITKTCNGNGDGHISAFGNADGWSTFESYLAWQQLGLAGLTGKVYAGTVDNRDSGDFRAALAGWNVPESRIKGAGYLPLFLNLYDYLDPTSDDRWMAVGHYMFFGNSLTDHNADPNTTLYEPSGPVISGTEAASLDGKIDDGVPNTGTVMSIYTPVQVPNCTELWGSSYRYISGNAIECALQFLMSDGGGN